MPESLAPDVVRFLQAKLPEWLKIDPEVKVGGRARPGMISARVASKRLALSSPTIGQFLKDGKGGMKLVRAVATFRFGKEDVTKIEDEAREWAAAHPERREIEPELSERVFFIAGQRGFSREEARSFVRDEAASTGQITEAEIVGRLTARRKAAKPSKVADTVISGDDDFSGGAADLKAKGKRRRR